MEAFRNVVVAKSWAVLFAGLILPAAYTFGGRAPRRKAVFQSKDDPHYQSMLQAIEQGKTALLAKPRMDMAGAVPIRQERDFGRTF